jgi:hypothetical protein
VHGGYGWTDAIGSNYDAASVYLGRMYTIMEKVLQILKNREADIIVEKKDVIVVN